MPARDKTGPEGTGPMTGRRLGKCGGNEQQYGGLGRGGRSGMGRRGLFNTDKTNVSEESSLSGDVRQLKNQISSLVKEITGLKNKINS